MSEPLKPGRQTVALRPSRIRRDPVRLEKQVEARSEELEILGGVAGVVLFAVIIAVLTIGISAATIFKTDPAATAQAARFGQCYNSQGGDCVIDGETIRVEGRKVAIAGIEAPGIGDASCPEERSRGIDSAVRLADLLNSGAVSVGPAFRDPYGRDVAKVQVDGSDVGRRMISADLAREYRGEKPDWCAAE